MKSYSDFFKPRHETLAGWTLRLNEVSDGVYEITLIDKLGSIASNKDYDLERGIETTIQYAFDIEKQINSNWPKFLFDSFMLHFQKQLIDDSEYSDKTFGSWYIQMVNNRIVYDGKDGGLIYQKKHNGEWLDAMILKKDEIYSAKAMSLLKFF